MDLTVPRLPSFLRLVQDLDDAVLDRMDDSLFFPLPDKKARAQLLVQVGLFAAKNVEWCDIRWVFV